MLQALRGSHQRFTEIFQHCQVGGHLLTVAPALDKAWCFVDGRVDQMGHVGHLPENLGTATLVGEINRQQGDALQAGRDATGDPDHVPVLELRKMPHGGTPDQTGCARDQHFSFRHRETSLSTQVPSSHRPPSAPELYKTLAPAAIVLKPAVSGLLLYPPLLCLSSSYKK